VYITGDVMHDAVLHYAPRAARTSAYPGVLGLDAGQYFLCTIHRADATDDERKLREIFGALAELRLPVVLPLHPRTRKKLAEFNVAIDPNVRIIDPVGYVDMLQLLQSSQIVLTDSGGLQKEAYYLGVPCVTLREETEWVETVASGWNRLAGQERARILHAVDDAMHRPSSRPNLYGDGGAALRIANILATA
jgi:UDP-N-acetylglucosamine 2-epimerase